MSTIATLEGFSNPLAWCSKHLFGAWTILYPLVEVREFWEMLMVLMKAPMVHSGSIIKHAK